MFDRSPVVAYVTQSERSPATVWTVRTDGKQKTRIGPGTSPLIAPSGQQVAASLSGTGSGSETGPALAIYWVAGEPPARYLNRATASATPLAWSSDLRYVAVSLQSTSATNAAYGSGLIMIDLGLHTIKRIARGQIYGASFSSTGPLQLVYARARSTSLSAPVNLYISKPDGSHTTALTHDGRSLNPVWGKRGIAYDRERLRRNDAPIYQIWLRSPSGPGIRRLTNIHVRSLVSGLVPLAFSGDGRRLLAEFEGQDTSEAWTVRVRTGATQRITVRGHPVQGAGISATGTTLLIEDGGFLEPASSGRLATIPFFGGRAKVFVAHGSQASWNGRP
jgi:hypothetical protein